VSSRATGKGRRRPRKESGRTPAGPRRDRYHHGDLRRALVEAALELVQREGPRGLTLRAAARLAGVSQAAPYRHFTDKQALLAAVAEEGFRAMTAEMRRATRPHAEEPLLRFRALGLSYVGFARDHPAQFRVMFGPEVADRSLYPSLSESAGETFRLLVQAIRECQKAGSVREGDPEDLATTAWSTVHGLSALVVDCQLGGEAKRVDDLAQRVTQNLFLGLGNSEGSFAPLPNLPPGIVAPAKPALEPAPDRVGSSPTPS
jgi:AcrR family transcriptional regulator